MECPICFNQFNDDVHRPLKAPCRCHQTLCHQCLETLLNYASFCPWDRTRWSGRNLYKKFEEATPSNYLSILRAKFYNSSSSSDKKNPHVLVLDDDDILVDADEDEQLALLIEAEERASVAAMKKLEESDRRFAKNFLKEAVLENISVENNKSNGYKRKVGLSQAEANKKMRTLWGENWVRKVDNVDMVTSATTSRESSIGSVNATDQLDQEDNFKDISPSDLNIGKNSLRSFSSPTSISSRSLHEEFSDDEKLCPGPGPGPEAATSSTIASDHRSQTQNNDFTFFGKNFHDSTANKVSVPRRSFSQSSTQPSKRVHQLSQNEKSSKNNYFRISEDKDGGQSSGVGNKIVPSSSRRISRQWLSSSIEQTQRADDQPQDEETWCCNICTFHNNMLLYECEMCETPRPPTTKHCSSNENPSHEDLDSAGFVIRAAPSSSVTSASKNRRGSFLSRLIDYDI